MRAPPIPTTRPRPPRLLCAVDSRNHLFVPPSFRHGPAPDPALPRSPPAHRGRPGGRGRRRRAPAGRRHAADHVRGRGRGPGRHPGRRAPPRHRDGHLRGPRRPAGADQPRDRLGQRGPEGGLRAARDGPPARQGLRRVPQPAQARPHQDQDAQEDPRRAGRPPLMAGPALRVGFAGTPEFAAVALQEILSAGFTVPLVLSQPDRPAGRGLKLTPPPVKALALQHGLAVAQPRSLRLDGKFPDEAAAGRAALEAAALDVLVVAAYGSLLPRWRGAAPIHRAIEAGDAETGITLMQMDEGLDTGGMLTIGREAIRPDDSTATLHDRLAALGGRLVVEALRRAEAGDALVATPQPEAGVNYAHKIEKAEGLIDWTLPAAVIERRVRAFDPFPGASFPCQGEAVKLWSARLAPGVPGAEPGTVLQASTDTLRVACGDGALDLLQLQRPSGKRGPVAAFLQARPGLAGQRLA